MLLSTPLLEVAKSILPFATGGLAGAVLTAIIGYRLRRKAQKVVAIAVRRVRYELPTDSEFSSSLRVAYGGTEFDDLALYEFAIRNASSRTLDSNNLLVGLDAGARVLEWAGGHDPSGRRPVLSAEGLKPGMTEYRFGRLHSGESASLKVLAASSSELEWHFQGDDDIVIESDDVSHLPSLEQDVRQLTLFAVLYLLAGAIPVLSILLKAGVLAAAVPRVISTLRKLQRRRAVSEGNTIERITVHEGGVITLLQGMGVVRGPGPAKSLQKGDG